MKARRAIRIVFILAFVVLLAEVVTLHKNNKDPELVFESVGKFEGRNGIYMTLINHQYTPITLMSYKGNLTHEYFESPLEKGDPGYILKMFYSEWNKWENYSHGEHRVFLEIDFEEINYDKKELHFNLIYTNNSIGSLITRGQIAHRRGNIYYILPMRKIRSADQAALRDR